MYLSPPPPHNHYQHRHRHHSSSSHNKNSTENDQQRTNYIIDTFLKSFTNDIRENPKGWRSRFRKMAANEFSFYRGSAVLFYRDMLYDSKYDPWLKKCKEASHVFIHGDLHAENFGTYIDRHGIINFDVNDFDEGYIGPFTWDVKRLVASINLITYSKAYSDEKIAQLIRCLVSSYLKQIYEYCNSREQHHMAITSENTHGPVNKLLKESRLGSREAHLDTMTVVENFERKFIRSKNAKDVDEQLRYQILQAFQDYLKTIPESKKEKPWSYRVKDIVARTSSGIGSAGRTSYSILVQGKTEALESDIILFMKPATQSAVSSVIQDQNLQYYFRHDGLRTVLCAYAMHAVTSKWLGYATLNNQIPLVVDEVTTHSKNLEWNNINDFEDICVTVEYLGKAMAKIHCISDIDSIEKEKHAGHHTDLLPLHIIPRHTERTIRKAIGGNDEGFIQDMISFAMTYGNRVRRDHRLFFEAFRNGRIPMLQVDESH
ncbi:unnamed protein product [Rotaria sordida]|uniref:DUF2252 domain-containing protein n=1 Tax=Rotaria sordida TaxID=392033 RepID=A0A819VN30_9BILA|nr:unnamed protein product [Rotaria sordida]CAF4111489.1 unnamed protein product [Rotaria sordida]